MKELIRFLAKPAVHRLMVVSFFVFTFLFFGIALTGCDAPTWLTEAQSIVPELVAGAGSLLTFLAALLPGAAPELVAAISLITGIATDVSNGLSDVISLIEQYNSNPSASLLTNIENAIGLVINNLQKLLGDFQVPVAVSSKIQAIAQMFLKEVEYLQSLIPTLKAHLESGTPLPKEHAALPYPKKDFKHAFNAILDAPTGDLVVDTALEKAHRL